MRAQPAQGQHPDAQGLGSVGPAHPVLDARDFAELVCAVRAEVPRLCVCLCDRLVRRGCGDGQRTAARREYLLFPVCVRTRLLHLPAQHREYRVLGRWTILLANPRCRNMFLLVDGRVTRCAAGHGARCRRPAACSRTRPAVDPPCCGLCPSAHPCPRVLPVQASWASSCRPTAKRSPCIRSFSFTQQSAG